MIRLAVEDAWFDVIGPAPTVQDGMRLADRAELAGAILDINLGDHHVFPLARHLRGRDVPFVFVSGYDSSILPEDMRAAPLISKPVLVEELTRLAASSFSERQTATTDAVDQEKRAAGLRARIATGERRLGTQRRRLERLQFEGRDRYAVQLTTDLLEQMQTSLDLLKQTLSILEKTGAADAAARAIARPISDDIIDAQSPQSVQHWAGQLGTTPGHLAELLAIHGSSARVVAKALSLEQYAGPSRRSTVPD
jgi:DNA-binding response OmpR family regulator